MPKLRNYLTPVLLGAALLFFVGLMFRNSLDPACLTLRAEHDDRMSRSNALLLRVSTLTSGEQCAFHQERAALLAEELRPGQACFTPARGADANRLQTEARLHADLAQGCTR
ncbi:hypothetical protein KX729_07350 [Rhizobium sp. XQZ8]|uniref:hypothetical protein n=1 Tax=Rhizobium populisoli TaxID=2859785 RepID=UPI001CA4E0F1|nr:hypothetical protein [Rhizobium populisoli]MBW6421253.1 hypothetical protein [Rhizobium populisoli]